MKIIGTCPTSFKGTDGTQIDGMTIFGTEQMDPKRGQGETADRFFLTTAKLDALGFTPAVGQTVEVFYNRYGKVATLRLVSDDDILID